MQSMSVTNPSVRPGVRLIVRGQSQASGRSITIKHKQALVAARGGGTLVAGQHPRRVRRRDADQPGNHKTKEVAVARDRVTGGTIAKLNQTCVFPDTAKGSANMVGTFCDSLLFGLGATS
jgi:hypothetical protein